MLWDHNNFKEIYSFISKEELNTPPPHTPGERERDKESERCFLSSGLLPR